VMSKLVITLCILAAAVATFLAYATANFSHGPDIAIPISGIALMNAIVAIAAWANRRFSTWILWGVAAVEISVVYYLVSEALYFGQLKGIDFVVMFNSVVSIILLIKIALEIRLGTRVWKA
jgi:hypothetical protein